MNKLKNHMEMKLGKASIRIVMVAAVMSFSIGILAQGYKLPHKGYSGDAGVGVGIMLSEQDITPSLNVYTTHGYNITPNFYLGAGAALMHETRYLTVYGQVRGALTKIKPTRSHYPFLSLNAGYVWSTWIGDNFGDESGVYLEPRFGWSFFSGAGNLRYDVFVGFSLFSLSLTPNLGFAFRF